MKNVSFVDYCYGCGVCSKVCGKKLINIKLDNYGFYRPFIEEQDSCTDCGLCLEVCSFTHTDVSQNNRPLASFASWSNNDKVRSKSSSGGVAFELGKLALSRGYKFCGVKYDAEINRAVHYVASDINDLTQSAGSKYIQSNSFNCLREIDKNQKYLFVGTPCQIDSLRRYINKFKLTDNFILVDFFCHGVPSMLAWDKYANYVAKRIGKISYASWRNKRSITTKEWEYNSVIDDEGSPVSWKDSYNMILLGESGSFQRKIKDGDMFLSLFLGNSCLGRQCFYNCKYKTTNSSADIRLGDFWGDLYSSNPKGVSSVITFTEKGYSFFLDTDCTKIAHTISDVISGQMEDNATKHPSYKWVLRSLLNNKKDIRNAYFIFRVFRLFEKIIKVLLHPQIILAKFKFLS